MTTFGERLRTAFDNAKNAEIARKLRVSDAAVKNYINGRVPNIDILLLINILTGRSLDWLLLGKDETLREEGSLTPAVDQLIKRIAAEQAEEVFADVQIGGATIEDRTYELLMNFLIARSLRAYNLIESESEVMSAADHKRAQRFTFIGNIPQSLEDRIGEIVERKISGSTVSSVAQEDAIRDMIRELVKEEISGSTKRPFLDMDFGHTNEDKKVAPVRKVA